MVLSWARSVIELFLVLLATCCIRSHQFRARLLKKLVDLVFMLANAYGDESMSEFRKTNWILHTRG